MDVKLEGLRAKIVEEDCPGMVEEIVQILCDLGHSTVIIGFPKERGFGWSDGRFPGYKCWYANISQLKVLPSMTNNKFK